MLHICVQHISKKPSYFEIKLNSKEVLCFKLSQRNNFNLLILILVTNCSILRHFILQYVLFQKKRKSLVTAIYSYEAAISPHLKFPILLCYLFYFDEENIQVRWWSRWGAHLWQAIGPPLRRENGRPLHCRCVYGPTLCGPKWWAFEPNSERSPWNCFGLHQRCGHWSDQWSRVFYRQQYQVPKKVTIWLFFN